MIYHRNKESENDDSFENILKIQMASMRNSFEKKIEVLNASLSEEKENLKKKMAAKNNEIAELKRVNELLSNRVEQLNS